MLNFLLDFLNSLILKDPVLLLASSQIIFEINKLKITFDYSLSLMKMLTAIIFSVYHAPCYVFF